MIPGTEASLTIAIRFSALRNLPLPAPTIAVNRAIKIANRPTDINLRSVV